MRTEFEIQPEAFAFEAEPSESEAWEVEGLGTWQPEQNRGSADYTHLGVLRSIKSLASRLRSTASRQAVSDEAGQLSESVVFDIQPEAFEYEAERSAFDALSCGCAGCRQGKPCACG
jgi:hypothetical protein